ncbi:MULTISPECIES: hypothetical protein [unclassified Myroides]|uniref:hypothetical protein n=1 Tax=unclassified Myroides TaxID=2642485 RepID=UPI003D2F8A8D
MNNKQSLTYASYSTIVIWLLIVVLMYFILEVSLPQRLSNLMYLIAFLSTFVSGFYLFNRVKEPWLLGIIHYTFAHILVLFLFFIWIFVDNIVALGISSVNLAKSFIEVINALFFSFLGIQYILPCFILSGYLSKKWIK